MKKTLSFIFTIFLSLALLVGCKKTETPTTGDSTTLTEGENTTSSQVTGEGSKTVTGAPETSVTGETTTQGSNLGSPENPLSVKSAYAQIAQGLAGVYSDEKIYVKGIIVEMITADRTYDDNHKSFWLADSLEDQNKKIEVFFARFTSTTEPHEGDEVVVEGHMYIYSGSSTTFEVTCEKNNENQSCSILSVVHKDKNITCSSENAVVTGLSTTAKCGEKVTFTVAPNEGYELVSVKVNSKTIRDNNGEYSFTVDSDTEVVVNVIAVGETTDIGSVDEPITCAEAYELVNALPDSVAGEDEVNLTDEKIYVAGYIISVTYDAAHESYTINACDNIENPNKVIKLYGANLDDEVSAPHKGDYIVFSGYGEKYKNYQNQYEYEISGSSEVGYPTIYSVRHNEHTITVKSFENGETSDIPGTANCGETVSFSVTPSEGYVVSSVKLGAQVIELDSATSMYSFTVIEDAEITITIVEEGAEVACDHVIIYEVYGGGGNKNATYSFDYVVLYNPTSEDVDLNGWSIQRASAKGQFNSEVTFTCPLTGTIEAGKYYLVQFSGGTTVTNKPLPYTPNEVGKLEIAAKEFKVALSNSTQAISGSSDSHAVDFFAVGGVNDSETSPLAAFSDNATAARRINFNDTNNNSADFSAVKSPSLDYLEDNLSK